MLQRLGLAGLAILAGGLVLLPWWRHHAFIRDFYDYGLVIAGVGRIAGGERPYVDFVTPIQSGLFLFNWLADTWGGGVFQGMVRGGAVLALAMLSGLWLLLSRRLAPAPALLVAFAVTAGSAAQHTIIWHNTVGVFCLALVAWGAAIGLADAGQAEPGLARPPVGAGWVVLVALALWIGGINKLNFHLLALAVALGWVARAVTTGRISPRGGAGLSALWLAAGVLLPLATELAWTGASWRAWWHNVVALPFGSRSGALFAALDWKFYCHSPHDYYGDLLLPQAGLLGVALSGLAGWAAWRSTRGSGRAWVVVAASVAAAGGVALLATNHEISHVALAASLVLAVALWLGFSVPFQGMRYRIGLLGLTALIAAGAWWSAWLGQRSQFGHSPAPRETYRRLDSIDPEFAYMEGTKVPPELLGSLSTWREEHPPADADGRLKVFYGPGAEWLTRIYPARHLPGLPLWIHAGTSQGPAEEQRLAMLLDDTDEFAIVLRPIAWTAWGKSVEEALARRYAASTMWPVMARWDRIRAPRDLFAEPLGFLGRFGGNVHAGFLASDDWPMEAVSDGQGGVMLGVTRRKGILRLVAPTSRVAGEAKVCVVAGAAGSPMWAEFHVRSRREGVRTLRWTSRVEVPAGASSVSAEFLIDGGGVETEYQVTVPEEFAGRIQAGYRGLRILHVGAGAGDAPRLSRRAGGDVSVGAETVAPLFATDWRPEAVINRGGVVTAQGFELPPGAEVWLRVPGLLATFAGQLHVRPDTGRPGHPVYRIVWGKGARVEIIDQGNLSPGAPRPFRMWSAEPDAWFGIINDEAEGGPPFHVRIDRVEPAR
jgi:hypothetical protein